MNTYKLLTPGPLTTTMTVKEQMLFDHCTWDDDYKQITQDIRAKLLELAHVNPERYGHFCRLFARTRKVIASVGKRTGNAKNDRIRATISHASQMALWRIASN